MDEPAVGGEGKADIHHSGEHVDQHQADGGDGEVFYPGRSGGARRGSFGGHGEVPPLMVS